MKKTLPLLLCLLLVLTGCGKTPAPIGESGTSEIDPPPGTVGIANPWTEHDTLEAAEKAVDFTLSAPEEIEGYGAPIYRTLSGELLEILYPAENGEIRIRKQAATDEVGNDISGDYNDYSEYSAIECSGENASITVSGNDGTASKAIWTVDGYAYSVTVEPAVDVTAMADLTAQIN